MKRFLVLLPLLALAAGYHGMATAQTPPASVGVSSQAEFDHDGRDTAGAAEALKDCDVALTAATVADLNAGGAITKQVLGTIKQGPNAVPLAPLFTGVPGGQYKLWVRARDEAGNVSRWTGSAAFTLDAAAPSSPANVRVTVIVTVGG